jgi:dTDP-4-amino-4,6-dideoxy-D-galactose acyltransferase
MTAITVEPVAGLPDGFDRLAAAWAFKPYRWISGASAPALDGLLTQRLAGTLAGPDVAAWAARCGGLLSGLAVLQRLEWDSRVLGLDAARLELIVAATSAGSRAAADALLARAAAEAERRGVRHISSRVDAADAAAVQGLETRGFVNVDALLTFQAGVEEISASAPIPGVVLRRGSLLDGPVLGEIAAASFRHGRFHSDPVIPADAAAAVYRTWATGCCEGTAADAVIVATIDNRPAGFVACRAVRETAVHLQRPTGTIPLIATAGSARGRGIGRALVAAAAGWCREHDLVSLDVGTQLSNVAAARLYEACGFRLVNGSLSFRLLIG